MQFDIIYTIIQPVRWNLKFFFHYCDVKNKIKKTIHKLITEEAHNRKKVYYIIIIMSTKYFLFNSYFLNDLLIYFTLYLIYIFKF